MQFSCSLLPRQWYDTRHESYVLQLLATFSQQIQSCLMRYKILLRIVQIFLF
jgi:hypothetical protein